MELYYSFDFVMNQLIRWGSIQSRKAAMKRGAGENQFGVGLTNIRDLARKIGKNHELGMDLWYTNNSDAMILGTLIMQPLELSYETINEMISMIIFHGLADEFAFNVAAKSVYSEKLALEWMNSEESMKGRAGWDILISKVVYQKQLPLSIDKLLDLITMNLKSAPLKKQEAMNRCLCEIGIHIPKYSQRCIQIGEEIGRLENKAVPKGCTSSYAPEWILSGLKKKGILI